MLLIRQKKMNAQRPTLNVQLSMNKNLCPLKSGVPSVMHACEALGAGAGRDRNLWDQLRPDQWPAAQNPAVKPARGGFDVRSVDDFYRRVVAAASVWAG